MRNRTLRSQLSSLYIALFANNSETGKSSACDKKNEQVCSDGLECGELGYCVTCHNVPPASRSDEQPIKEVRT